MSCITFSLPPPLPLSISPLFPGFTYDSLTVTSQRPSRETSRASDVGRHRNTKYQLSNMRWSSQLSFFHNSVSHILVYMTFRLISRCICTCGLWKKLSSIWSLHFDARNNFLVSNTRFNSSPFVCVWTCVQSKSCRYTPVNLWCLNCMVFRKSVWKYHLEIEFFSDSVIHKDSMGVHLESDPSKVGQSRVYGLHFTPPHTCRVLAPVYSWSEV